MDIVSRVESHLKRNRMQELRKAKYALAKYGAEMNLEELSMKNMSGYDKNDVSKSALVESCRLIFRTREFKYWLILQWSDEKKKWNVVEVRT